jgi:hypothetical protein
MQAVEENNLRPGQPRSRENASYYASGAKYVEFLASDGYYLSL